MRETSAIMLLAFVAFLIGGYFGATTQLEIYVEEGIERKVLVERKDVCEAELPRNQSCKLVWYWEAEE